MKHLKTFESSDTYDLDFGIEEEESIGTDLNSLLIECVQSAQQVLGTYGDKEDVDVLIQAAESTVETSQLLLNFINRKYGPIDNIKESSKQILTHTMKDMNKFSNHDLVGQCVENCKQVISQL